EVLRVVDVARRHELGYADGAGIGALGDQRIEAIARREKQELAQLLREEVAAARVAHGQRGQAVYDTVVALDGAEAGLDADDGGDDVGVDAVTIGRATQGGLVLVHEAHTAVDG